jgi:hypothetical protein
MYIEIMFANRNNHLLKKLLKGGGIETPFAEIPSLVKTLPFSMDLSPEPIPVDPYDMPAQEPDKAPAQEPDKAPAHEPDKALTPDYPDTNYLYKNITSNQNISKINVCAFNKGDFIKYIVQEEDGRVIFPSFVFENTQKGGFLDGDRAPTDLDNIFKQKVEDFVKTFFSQTGGDGDTPLQRDPKPNRVMQEQTSQQKQTLPENVQQNSDQEELSQERVEPNLDENISQSEKTPDENISQEQQTPDENISQEQQNPDENISQEGVEQTPEEKSSREEVPQVSQEGVSENAAVEEPSAPTSTYIGYIMVNGEPYVFVSVSGGKLAQQFREAILNELFYIFKVDNLDVDQTVKDLFDNNRWLLNESEPYSGYMCKMDEAGQLVNIKHDDESEDMTNVESIGDFYYFSFQPIDSENSYKKFVIFPNEYVCILDESQMEQYKANKMSYAEEKTIYFKGDALDTKRNGIEFMCIRTPSSFVQF